MKKIHRKITILLLAAVLLLGSFVGIFENALSKKETVSAAEDLTQVRMTVTVSGIPYSYVGRPVIWFGGWLLTKGGGYSATLSRPYFVGSEVDHNLKAAFIFDDILIPSDKIDGDLYYISGAEIDAGGWFYIEDCGPVEISFSYDPVYAVTVNGVPEPLFFDELRDTRIKNIADGLYVTTGDTSYYEWMSVQKYWFVYQANTVLAINTDLKLERLVTQKYSSYRYYIYSATKQNSYFNVTSISTAFENAIKDDKGDNISVNASNGQLVDKFGSPLLSASAKPVFRNNFGQYIGSDGEYYSVNSAKKLVDEKGYVVHQIDPNASVYMLELKNGIKVPTTREQKNYPWWQWLLAPAATAALSNYDYYLLNGVLLNVNEYKYPFLDLFLNDYTGKTVADYANPEVAGGDIAVKDKDGNIVRDYDGHPLGALKSGQLVDPWGYPIYDTNAKPLYIVNNDFIDWDGNLLTITSNVLYDFDGNKVKCCGGQFDGYMIPASDNMTWLPVKSYDGTYFYDMNNVRISNEDIIIPNEVLTNEENPLEHDGGLIEKMQTWFEEFFGNAMSSILPIIIGIVAVILLIVFFPYVMQILIWFFKMLAKGIKSLFKGIAGIFKRR